MAQSGSTELSAGCADPTRVPPCAPGTRQPVVAAPMPGADLDRLGRTVVRLTPSWHAETDRVGPARRPDRASRRVRVYDAGGVCGGWLTPTADFALPATLLIFAVNLPLVCLSTNAAAWSTI